jgi:SRSO17 transposase
VQTDGARALLRRLGRFLDGFSGCFTRRPQVAAASRYLDGLFNDSERKSMQAMHGRLSDPANYQALQHFITHSPWDADRVWRQLRTQIPARTGILALDDTGFPKQGKRSVGVQRQYCGALGKVGHCQVAVSSALLADGRTWPLTFELYLPASWLDDADRRAAAGIPATKSPSATRWSPWKGAPCAAPSRCTTTSSSAGAASTCASSWTWKKPGSAWRKSARACPAVLPLRAQPFA